MAFSSPRNCYGWYKPVIIELFVDLTCKGKLFNGISVLKQVLQMLQLNKEGLYISISCRKRVINEPSMSIKIS